MAILKYRNPNYTEGGNEEKWIEIYGSNIVYSEELKEYITTYIDEKLSSLTSNIIPPDGYEFVIVKKEEIELPEGYEYVVYVDENDTLQKVYEGTGQPIIRKIVTT